MPKISRAFFYLTELPIRWGRSLPEITGWALAGRLNIMVPIAPVQCGIERASGIVRVRAEDVARLFHPDHPINLSCAVIRILPPGAHSDTSDHVFRRHMISDSGVSDHPEMTPSGAVW